MKKRFPLLIILFLFCLRTAAQKNDTIYMLNGDRITGELKKMEYGLIYLTTEGLTKITIEFDKVNSMHSAKYFEIRTTSSIRYFGSISKSNDTGSVILITAKDTLQKPIWDIVQISSIKDRIISKIDGSLGLGLNYTKASDVLQYNVTAQVLYRATNYSTVFDLSSIITNENNGGITRNNNVSLGTTRYMKGRWFSRIQGKAQQNTELDLKLRLQAGLAAGYDLLRTNTLRFYSMGGLLYNHESTLDSTTVSDNMEGVLSLQFKKLQHRHPKIDLSSGFSYYSSITINNRYRLEFNINARIEIIRDFYFNLNFYDAFDSKTLSDNTRKNDFGVVSSFSYTF